MLRSALLFALLIATSALAEEPQRPAITEATKVLGAGPRDLVGRWLVVSRVALPGGKVRPAIRTWEIRPGADHLELLLDRSALPPNITAALNAAGAAGTDWTPQADDLRAVNATWDVTSPLERPYTSVESKLYAADAYTDEFRADETTKDAPLALTIEEKFAGQSLIKTFALYGIRERTPSTLRGTFVTTSI